MMDNGLTMRTRVAGRRHLRGALTLAMAGALLLGCGGGSSFGDDSSWFGQLFGGRGEAPPPVDNELFCPPVRIRPGASTFAVGLPGKPAAGADLRYQATISRTARDCTQNGDQITARIGILGTANITLADVIQRVLQNLANGTFCHCRNTFDE